MPTVIDSRRKTEAAVQRFGKQPLRQAALGFLDDLGYRSQLELKISGVDAFRSELDQDGRLNPEQALLKEWKNVEFLRQVTGRDLSPTGELFRHDYDPSEIQSYVFLAIDLKNERYTRNKLSQISRAVNRIFMMPALLIFKHGESLTFSVVNRRLNKRDQSRDVLEKVTLIKDISTEEPLRAHTEILTDLSLEPLRQESGFRDFEGLHNAWTKKLSSYALNERFYREISDWYFWSRHLVEEDAIKLPLHCDTAQEKSLFLIRLLTRLIFCWFLVEKKLLPASLFRPHKLESLLKDLSPDSSTYYHAILQNLFFGTLNMPPAQRGFREKRKEGERYDKNYGITNLWRYEKEFRDPDKWVEICRSIPFLNGGLFDCLDDKSGKKKDNFILDGFSDRDDFGCHLPNELFFGGERAVDLSKDYGEENKRTARSKRAKVSGLIEILSRYKFTIEENTPLEEEIALDPELLGKVFENLLASYNEDTKTTARKALGAFYTPREIVSYMVDESLKSYLATKVPRCKGALEDLFSNKATLKEIKPDTRDALIKAIGQVKILDPACGSGAFPMGALHRLVDLLQKLDPNNESWKRDRLTEARRYREILAEAGASKEEIDACDGRITDIEKSFDTRFHALDYARKLFLIENCIYGVDIQPIATQIAKLRFFISLVVDQKTDAKADNLGVRPLPNLETRIVAADTLIPIPRPKLKQTGLFEDQGAMVQVDKLKEQLQQVRHDHFNARDPKRKRMCKEKDQELRAELGALLRSSGLTAPTAAKLAAWDPYDQNEFARFFDSEWMFGLPVGKVRVEGKASATLLGNLALINEAGGQTELTANAAREIDSGFDVVIGNPPYVRQEKIKNLKPLFQSTYPDTYTGTADLYVYFYDCALRLLRPGGTLSYITSNSFLNSAFGEKLRHHLATTTRLIVLVDFAEANVFTAITEPCVLLASKGAPSASSFKALRWDQGKKPENFVAELNAKAFIMPQSVLSRTPWRIEVSSVRDLLELLSSRGKSLGQFVANRFYYGLKTGLNEAFVLDQNTRDKIALDKKSARYLKPFLRGKDLRRWQPEHGDQWLIVIPSSENATHPWSGHKPAEAEKIFQQELPGIFEHFKPLRAKLIARADQGQYYWELRSCTYYEQFAKAKVIYQEINRTDSYAFDDSGLYMNNKLFMLPEAPIWLVGILNSPVAKFFLHRSTGVPEGGFLALQWPVFSPLPVAEPNRSQTPSLVSVVNILRLLTAQFAADPGKQTTRDPLMMAYWERVLNGSVYELYFPEELHSAGLHFFDLVASADLPDINDLAENDRLPRLRQKFEELHDGTHPLRQALDKIQTLETVRIIEGKA
jgi:adenine-specific DNA-methyltransferase